MIRIQRLVGPEAGLQTAHTEPVITIGRTADNTIMIEHEHVSRRHAELRAEAGGWVVVNQSVNGTTVNGRAIAADKPHALRTGDQIGVGKQRLVAVQFATAAGETAGAAPPDQAELDAQDAQRREKFRRARNWALIAFCGLWALLIFVMLILPGGDDADGGALPPQLSDRQIADEIRSRPQVIPDERQAAQHLAEAQQWYNRTESHDAGLYNAYHHYQMALAYSGRETFAGVDQLQFQSLEQKLIDHITENYRDAYAKSRLRQWQDAEEMLRYLQRAYPEPESQIWQNVGQQLDVVIANRPKRRSF